MEQDCQASSDTAQANLATELARTQEAAVGASAAAARAAKRSKDHELAKEVVVEAQTLVRELFGVAEEAGAFLQATPSQAGQQAAADQALKEVEAAEKGLQAMVDAHTASATDLAAKLDALKAKAKK